MELPAKIAKIIADLGTRELTASEKRALFRWYQQLNSTIEAGLSEEEEGLLENKMFRNIMQHIIGNPHTDNTKNRITMKKPYIICHMASSIDGKIIYDNWSDDIPKAKYSALYNECHESFESQGWILGRVSLEEDFSKGIKPELIRPESPIKREPFFGDRDAETYAVTFDTKGRLGWDSNEIGGDHIIAVLIENVSDEYLYYLQRQKISYIFAGQDRADLKLALEQLAQVFSIEKIMLEGGGHLNGSFLNEGLIDEISLLLLPIADGTENTQTVFEVNHYLHKNPATQLKLIQVQQLENDILWLKYKTNNAN